MRLSPPLSRYVVFQTSSTDAKYACQNVQKAAATRNVHNSASAAVASSGSGGSASALVTSNSGANPPAVASDGGIAPVAPASNANTQSKVRAPYCFCCDY